MTNRYFGNVDAENPYAKILNQGVSTYSNPIFKFVNCETPIITRYEDLNVAPFTTSLGPSIRPPLITKVGDDGAGSEGTYLYAFEEGKTQEIFFTCQLSHSYREGTDLKPHCHIMIPTIQANSIIDFGLEYTFINVNDTMTNTTILSNALPSPDTALKHSVHSLGVISGVGKKISAILVCRLFRKNVVANSYTSPVYLLSFDFHYQISTIGSQFEYHKGPAP